jgi:uncharacterized membrane protein
LPTMSVPRLARAGFTRAATVVAVGTLIFGVFAPAVSADDGLEITTQYPAVAVAPGSKVSFDLTVASTRTGTVALALEGVPTGWTASLHGGGFVVDGVAVTASEEAEARLDITVPGDAPDTTQTIRITGSQPGARDTLAISIRVNAEAAGDITLTTTNPVLTGASDTTFPFSLTLRNDTAQDVTVSATGTVPDHPDWDVEARISGSEQAASTVVTAGGSTTINVTVTPAENAVAGQYIVQVEAKANERTIQQQLGVELTGSYSLTLSTPNQVLSTSGGAGTAKSQQFVVTNTGTAALEGVTLSATAPTDWTVTFDPESVGPIGPNESATVTAQITPSGEAVTGDYALTVRAENDQADASQSIRFTVETSPLWTIVTIGIIALILGGLFYVFRTYGRR